uniref:Succinate dehydrogenase subunit D n=1 Tax=Candidatus Kentrum eta TaxID=2126337 RepID=A0A450V616_9GAMM|nr:MAG: succinate dehydrogenase subunit D [Candidatus Kentron sp. H]VFK00493.1 MAG: succinate dehydrogenase subunit D [Candidatus Kentron sp. H]VFK04255.1 MAG: succinate dehydrogenase subunit D [Candidatus Kentron sp. H]
MSGSSKISNKPIIWGLFAGGGTLTAFLTPVLVLITLLVALGAMPEAALSYEAMHGFAAHWLGKLILFGVLFLSLWHAAHRFRITLHDFGIRADIPVAIVLYLLAGIGTIMAIMYLLPI